MSPTGLASDTGLVGRALEIGIASGREIATVQDLWEEYWNSVGLPRNFQDFEEEQKSLPGRYAPPKGRLLLAVSGGMPRGRLHSARLPNLPARPNVYTFARDIAGRASAGLFWIDW
ncbi:MAG TPA: hypothetical protein VLI55_11925 [Bryobacteraceae bacterium]|nr:hypothetical protein [Bryobacteraceae bacterium]